MLIKRPEYSRGVFVLFVRNLIELTKQPGVIQFS